MQWPAGGGGGRQRGIGRRREHGRGREEEAPVLREVHGGQGRGERRPPARAAREGIGGTVAAGGGRVGSDGGGQGLEREVRMDWWEKIAGAGASAERFWAWRRRAAARAGLLLDAGLLELVGGSRSRASGSPVPRPWLLGLRKQKKVLNKKLNMWN